MRHLTPLELIGSESKPYAVSSADQRKNTGELGEGDTQRYELVGSAIYCDVSNSRGLSTLKVSFGRSISIVYFLLFRPWVRF